MQASLFMLKLYSLRQNQFSRCIVSAMNEEEARQTALNDWGYNDSRVEYCEFVAACTLAESDYGSISKAF